MRILLLLLPLLVAALGGRRLTPGVICTNKPYVLAQGAPTPLRGRTFSDKQGGYLDPRNDTTGVGTALLNAMPVCLQEKATSIRVDGTALWQAVAWLDLQCAEVSCIVFTKYQGLHGRFHVAES